WREHGLQFVDLFAQFPTLLLQTLDCSVQDVIIQFWRHDNLTYLACYLCLSAFSVHDLSSFGLILTRYNALMRTNMGPYAQDSARHPRFVDLIVLPSCVRSSWSA